MMLARILTAALLAASPAAAQYYPQPYPQQAPQQYPAYPQQGYPGQYPQYPQQSYPGETYPQQGYGYQVQPYGTTESAIAAIVDSLIGNRYAVGDRTAIRQCAWAAVQRAQTREGPNTYGGYQGYPGSGAYPNSGYAMPNVRVTAITAVEHRSRGTRVRGLLDAGLHGGPRYGYNGQGYGGGYGYAGGGGDLSFRCDTDYRGYVYDVRLDRIARPY
jgi:hypothetical protein